MAEQPHDDYETLMVVEERAVVHKRTQATGVVRVHTVVHEEEQVIDTPLSTEEVEVERIALDRWVDEPVPVRQEGDTTIITVHQEVVVTAKRLKVVEEVRMTKRRVTRQASERVGLRREEVVVERTGPLPDRE